VILPARPHLLGIGGAGMSSLAFLLSRMGIVVSGSDPGIAPTLATRLAGEGVRVLLSHDPIHLDGVDQVVVSSAIAEDNPELQAALRLGLPICHRVDLLRHVAEGKQLITVAGTHGKGTTTGLLASILRWAGWDPSLANGAELVDFGERCWWGRGEYFVMETDESDGSFLKLVPRASLVTNIDRDHMNFWGNEEGLHQGFRRFSERVEETLVLYEGTTTWLKPKPSQKALTYGWGLEADYRLENLRLVEDGLEAEARTPFGWVCFTSPLVGEHNALNILGALAMADTLDISRTATLQAIASYSGIRRRLERRKPWQGALVFDDHADHPTEIARSISALLPLGRPILAVLQPHRYSRVRALLKDYGPALQEASRVIVLPICSAGEKIKYQLRDQDVFEQIRHANPDKDVRFSSRPELVSLLRSLLHPGEILLLMGPGDIAEVADQLEVPDA
jgi:UDP-N-acetylmuramate--alanine ligase